MSDGESENELIYPSGATTETVAAQTDGSQAALTNVVPGEDINVQVAYSTTDENENGEGESLTISTSGGDSVSDASYNATSVYNFVATAAGESVSATPVGWDGDESAMVTVTVSSLSGSSITPAQEGAFSVGSSDLDTSAAGLGTVGASFAGGVSTYSQGAVDAADAASALDATLAADFSDLSIDPIDTNYTTVVRPAKTTTAILPTPKDFKGIKNAGPLAASIRALDLNEEKSINLAVAADATANKLEGALAVGNTKWAKKQQAVLKSYKKQLSALVKAQVVLSNNEAKQLNKSPFGNETVSSTDVNNFEETVNDDGLPSQLLTDLNDLGLSSAAQATIQQAIFAQDIDTASGTYASILTNPTLEADLAKVSLLLKGG